MTRVAGHFSIVSGQEDFSEHVTLCIKGKLQIWEERLSVEEMILEQETSVSCSRNSKVK